ncbi:hypothetical protein BGX24_012618 [Mortierella sp. AD032]|nr:hypothetical protein BGX24_012618 [Mortierella sp. AD032]
MKRESGIASATDESKKRRLEAPDATSSQATPIGNASQYPYFYRDPNLHAYPFDAVDKAHQKKKGLAKSEPTPEATTSTTEKAPAPALYTTEKASAPATPTAISVSRTLPHQELRTVYIGKIPQGTTMEAILDLVTTVESLKLLVDKNFAYMYLTSIESAIKTKASLSIDHQYLHRRLSYGVDRCVQLVLTRMFLLQADKPRSTEALTKVLTSEGRRNVFLGNLYEDTTVEEICDVVTGVLLGFIKRQPKRKSAFVCFVDPSAAAKFVEHATTQAIKIKERTLKVGWGDDAAHRLPEDVINVFKMGATRTVYIGIIKGLVSSRLKTDFAVFGEVEKVSICQDRNCAFINFPNVLSAVGAVQGIKVGKPEYEPRRIGFGRDRCARPLDGIPPQAPDYLDTQRPANIETLAKETVQKSDGSAASAYDPHDIAELEGSDDDMDISE